LQLSKILEPFHPPQLRDILIVVLVAHAINP
jgi:hypothetical protein